MDEALKSVIEQAAAGRIYGIGGYPFDLFDLDDPGGFADFLKRKGKLHRLA